MKHICCSFALLCFVASSSLLAQDLYDLDHIPKIELSFIGKDWQYPLHYYYSLKKGDRQLGTAMVNGEEFDSVGVRFKGFSSYSRKNAKNPLNIKLDYIHKKAAYQKYETIKLSNGNLDPSWLREVLAYQIARKYMVAPRANYAQVFVNKEYYGLFGNIESVDGTFGKRYLKTDKKSILIKGNSPLGPFSGKRSSLEYLGEDSTAYFSAYELKSNEGWGELIKLCKALKEKSKNIEDVLNMDGAIWMLAFNNILVNLDSYSDFQQNYYLMQDNNGRFHFIIWDVNLSFDGLGKPEGVTMQPDYDPLAKQNDEKFPLINFVLNDPTFRKIYFAHCNTILKENFTNAWYKEVAEKHRNLIRNAVQLDTNWIFNLEAFETNFREHYINKKDQAFPFPGIVPLMEARTEFLQNHSSYKKEPPIISKINARYADQDSSLIVVNTYIENSTKRILKYRYKKSELFQQDDLYDDGRHQDGKAGDHIFGAILPAKGRKLQYYIFAENKEAVFFSPERATYEYYIFGNKKEKSKKTNKLDKGELPF